MKKVCLLFTFLISCTLGSAQSVEEKLARAVINLEKDKQFEAALISLYVIEMDNGGVVFERNSRYGMAAASSQKLFTAAALLETLGAKYTYRTEINVYEQLKDSLGSAGHVEIIGSGDPSLGSWRFPSTRKDLLLQQWSKAIISARPALSLKNIYTYDFAPGYLKTIPEGYIWQDIGNYYGAGTTLLNWNENQYDIVFKSGSPGSNASVLRIDSAGLQMKFRFSVKAGDPGSGDNTYIYSSPFSDEALVSGTVPPNQGSFTISGSVPDPGRSLASALSKELASAGNVTAGNATAGIRIESSRNANTASAQSYRQNSKLVTTFSHRSPSLDTLTFWFMRKSINLYGEAFVKTLANEKKDGYNLEKGLDHILQFWEERGIARSGMSLLDGSGLSPQNRVTTKALVQVLRFSAGREWFPAFLHALPTYNGMKMKSGSINGARAFAGYHTSAIGKKYAFAIIVNNYSGSSGEVVKKMYRVLDLLK